MHKLRLRTVKSFNKGWEPHSWRGSSMQPDPSDFRAPVLFFMDVCQLLTSRQRSIGLGLQKLERGPGWATSSHVILNRTVLVHFLLLSQNTWDWVIYNCFLQFWRLGSSRIWHQHLEKAPSLSWQSASQRQELHAQDRKKIKPNLSLHPEPISMITNPFPW